MNRTSIQFPRHQHDFGPLSFQTKCSWQIATALDSIFLVIYSFYLTTSYDYFNSKSIWIGIEGSQGLEIGCHVCLFSEIHSLDEMLRISAEWLQQSIERREDGYLWCAACGAGPITGDIVAHQCSNILFFFVDYFFVRTSDTIYIWLHKRTP
jgi:hypothetical protein